MVEPLRHRQTKGAATDMFYLTPPRHISTLHFSDVTARADDVSSLDESRHCGCEYLRSDFDPRVRPLQPWGGGWSNLWSLSAQDPWAWFIRKNSSSSNTSIAA